MNVERGNLEILFRKIPYCCITENHLPNKNRHDYRHVDQLLYLAHAKDLFCHNSENELINHYMLIKQEVDKGSVFSLITQMAGRFLAFDGSQIRCRLEELLRWREISFQLGQEFFTCAFLAEYDLNRNRETDFFAWVPIIKSDDLRLHNILSQGIADNHFHLNGSTKIFELNWICLMNIIENRRHDFAKIERGLQASYFDGINGPYRKESFYGECQRAALYRVYLFSVLRQDRYLTEKSQGLYDSLQKGVPVQTLTADIQDAISLAKSLYGAKFEEGHILDYCLQKEMKQKNNNECRLLAGERKFLYECYKACLSGQFTHGQCNAFYVYLSIRTHFRGELIQINRRPGFANFKKYQDRKEAFIDGIRLYEKELVRLAVNEPLSKGYMHSLEARLCPGENPAKLHRKLKNYDRIIEKKEYKDKLLYVLHFPKSPDRCFAQGQPRNHTVRRSVEKQALCIHTFLKRCPGYANMVRGIDACSNEIGCRPEVFAQGYRYLSDILFTKTPSNEDFRLYMTYHAGEDFLDIVDGLRAIDEAVLFCGLHRGSRIGHALALGVNPFDYYGYKSGILTIEKQVLLDDIAWLLCKTEEVGSNMDYKLKSSLEEKFYLLFEETYGHILPEISIREYYLGWKLRGDNPEIYQTGIDRNDIKYHSGFNKYSLNPWIPGTIRGSGKKAAALFRAYHYDGTVYKKGSERCTFKIEENYAQAVYDLQEKMIRQIAYGGIAIESNPSSNYLIGTISKYEEHPIFRFNAGKLLKDVPETAMNVSINTDDQGVFDTMLENEYALMALALRKARDSEGYRYDIEAIYEWIDSVRKMGIGQVFR